MKLEGRSAEVELGEHLALHLDTLGRALLHMRGIGEGRAEIGRDRNAREERSQILVVEQAVRGELRDGEADEGERLLRRIGRPVMKRNLVPGSREGDRPGTPDQSRADDRDACHA